MSTKSMSLISMAKILNEIIQEAGDLDNIESYPFTKIKSSEYSFEIDDKMSATVDFEMSWNKDEIASFKLPIKVDPFDVYNVSYEIDGVQTQAKKTDYKTLIKIMKTISDIIIKFVSENKDAKVLTLFPANKNADKLLTKSDPQKYSLYKTIIVNNIKQMSGDWNFSQVKYLNFSGLVLYKK